MSTIAVSPSRPHSVRKLLLAVVVLALVLSSFLIGRATHHSSARISVIPSAPAARASIDSSFPGSGYDCQRSGQRVQAC
jgi:hypothetical protein